MTMITSLSNKKVLIHDAKVGLNNIHKKNQLDYLYVQLELLTIKY